MGARGFDRGKPTELQAEVPLNLIKQVAKKQKPNQFTLKGSRSTSPLLEGQDWVS